MDLDPRVSLGGLERGVTKKDLNVADVDELVRGYGGEEAKSGVKLSLPR